VGELTPRERDVACFVLHELANDMEKGQLGSDETTEIHVYPHNDQN
jgi:hypothetical protein